MANPYFNAAYYLTNNPDVFAAGYTIETAESHYLAHGANEAFSGANTARKPAPWFDVQSYLTAYPDLIQNGITPATAFQHFIDHGINEGRSPASGVVLDKANLLAYAKGNADLAAAFDVAADATTLTDAQEDALAQHFYQYGYKEARSDLPANVDMQPGDTFVLTAGADAFTGTAANDIFNALTINATTGGTTSTLGAFDSIDGGAGDDTMNVYADTGLNVVQQGTIKNVETINIYNQGTVAADLFGETAGVDASKFAGATAINQFANANKVVNLGATTTAGFNGVTATGATALNVAAAATATSTSLKLDSVKGAVTSNVVSAVVAGAALNSVAVSGSLAQTTTGAGSAAASLDLGVTAGKDVQSVTVTTGLNTALTVGNDGATWTSTKDVNAIDASASTGAITFNANATGTTVGTGNSSVATLKTGAGNDIVGLSTALTSTVKAASVAAGAGDDRIVVNVDATAAGTGSTVTVDAGAGKDTINLTIATGTAVTYNVNAGAGDDKVAIAGAAVKTTDVIDGGEGTDTVALGGSPSYNADSYIVLNKVLKSFEAVQFTSAAGSTTAFDASQASNYKSFTFDAGGQIVKVGADQALVTAGDLTATASGYVAATGTAATTYAGALNVTASGGTAGTPGTPALDPDGIPASGDEVPAVLPVPVDNTTVAAFADSITLTSKATTADAFVGLTGDVKSAVVTLANSVDSATAPTADTIANFSLTTAVTGGALTAAQTSQGNLASLTLSGNGSASVTNGTGTALVSVDASQLGGVYTVGPNAGTAIAGLTYSSTNAAVETIKLGSGIDNVTLGASTYGKVDTIEGFNLVMSGTTLDTAKSDALSITGLTDLTSASKFTTTQTDLDLALKEAAAFQVDGAPQNTAVFHLGGDTYIYQDNGGDNVVGDADIVVKLAGQINLDALVLAV